MLDSVDSYCWEERRKILTPAQTHIPALRTFGICSKNHVSHPLLPHMHRGCIEIVFLTRGFQIYEAADGHFNLSGSDIFVAYPDEPHSSGRYPESVCDFIWLQINVSEDMPFFGLNSLRAGQLRAMLLGLPRLFSGDAPLRSALYTAFHALSRGQSADNFYGEQLLVNALIRMTYCAQNPRLHQSDSIGDAIAYINDNIAGPLPLEEVAACAGLSVSRFKVRFKEETGATPREYINHIKIDTARQLIAHGGSITDAALRLGFNTPNYFAVMFKKYTGLTPTQFRAETKARPSVQAGEARDNAII